MSWDYSFTGSALTQLKNLDRKGSQRILAWLDEFIVGAHDPKQWGRELKGEFAGLWRYRIENYRVICQLMENQLIVLVVRVSHSENVY